MSIRKSILRRTENKSWFIYKEDYDYYYVQMYKNGSKYPNSYKVKINEYLDKIRYKSMIPAYPNE